MQNVHLVGSEDVSRAGYTMREAAQTMASAASSIQYSLEMHQRFMDDWLIRFEDILTNVQATQTMQGTQVSSDSVPEVRT